MQASNLKGKVIVSVGEGEYTELGEFEIPVIMRMAPIQPDPKHSVELTLDVPDLKVSIARALREIAARLDPHVAVQSQREG